MKKRVLFVFKHPYHWNPDVINKFSNYYEVDSLHISDFKEESFNQIISKINKIIESKKIEITIFDVDYFKFTNLFFIEKIKCNKKVLITGDDVENHEMNSITASSCDIVLTHDPLSVLKFREKGFETHQIHFDNGKIANNPMVKKEIDVLYFGILNTERKEFLDYIVKQNISLKNVGHFTDKDRLSDGDLFDLIQKSKIVINFSKTRSDFLRSHTSKNLYKFHYMFEGRIALAGLYGAACVSEYSPGQEILFSEEEIPYFYTKEECVEILKKLLSNDEILGNYTKKFVSKSKNLFEDKKNMKPIFDALEKKENRKVKIYKIPYWYLRTSAKQITVRNMGIFNPSVILSNFKEVLKILEKGNTYEKLFILTEFLLNTVWYSLRSVFNKKNKLQS